ncbi:MAG TPA: hypothetical protein VGH28_18805 [Polyangiaceae bacterium]|jgi:hypothetical protein
MMDTLLFLVELAVPVAFVVLAVLFAKRVGGAGPWLLALVGVVDALLFLAFRAARWMAMGPRGYGAPIERIFNTLRFFDALAMFGCGFVALLACFLLMPKTPR